MQCDRNKWLCLICKAGGWTGRECGGWVAVGPWRRRSMARREVSYWSQWNLASFPSTLRGIRQFGSRGHWLYKWTCLYWSPGSAANLQGLTFFVSTGGEGCRKKTFIYWWTKIIPAITLMRFHSNWTTSWRLYKFYTSSDCDVSDTEKNIFYLCILMWTRFLTATQSIYYMKQAI